MENNVLTNVLTMPGSGIKSLGEVEIKGRRVGQVEGMLCLFSTADDPDATSERDFFDDNTRFNMVEGQTCPIYYHHGLDPRIGVKQIGVGTLHRTAQGIAIKADIWLDDADGARIYQEACEGKHGWSSGTAAHLVQRRAVAAKGARVSNHIGFWPLGLDASLTPTPAEPRNVAHAIKSLLDSSQIEVKFDQNQPRDKDGKWASGATVMRTAGLGVGTVVSHEGDKVQVRWHEASHRLNGNTELHTTVKPDNIEPHDEKVQRARLKDAHDKASRTFHTHSASDAAAIVASERAAGRYAVSKPNVYEGVERHTVTSVHPKDTRTTVTSRVASESEAQVLADDARAAGREVTVTRSPFHSDIIVNSRAIKSAQEQMTELRCQYLQRQLIDLQMGALRNSVHLNGGAN